MFTNIILLSLLTIIYGINGESGNQNLREQQQNAYNLLDVPTQHEGECNCFCYNFNKIIVFLTSESK